LVLVLYGGFVGWAAGLLRLGGGGGGMEAGVGFVGGVLGGIAGPSGPPPIVWGALKAWPKAQRRQTLQVFNTLILLAMLMASLFGGRLSIGLLMSSAIALTATFASNC